MKQILLIRPDKAGDAIKTLPALRAAVSHFENDRIALLCSQNNASIFAYEPRVRTFTLPKEWESLSDEDLSTALQKLPLISKYDIAILLPCDRFSENEKLLNLVHADKKFSSTITNPAHNPEELNIAKLVSEGLEVDLTLNLKAQPRSPILGSLDREEAFRVLGPKFQKRIAICPFAGTIQRSHSLRRWKYFLKLVRSQLKDTELYVFGTKNDKAFLEYLAPKKTDFKILYPSSFRTLGAYFEKMDGVIAVDSGPLHLAQAMGIPCLGILSGGDFKRWFNSLTNRDRLVTRGVFSRYPNILEMFIAFKHWSPK